MGEHVMSERIVRRRVVTGHNAENRSCVASDTALFGEDVPGMPGNVVIRFWGADKEMVYPDSGDEPQYAGFYPNRGGFRCLECSIPPDTVAETALVNDAGADETALGELETKMPGLATVMSGEDPGMHRTATVDMVLIVDGQCILRLDEEEVALGVGDLVIQSGTRHAWGNPYDRPCRFLAVTIGAKNDLCE
ncbi:cupin domain-containing protein [Kineobactrum salinum]|uniref:Cupin domain-containing protein n=1 Tax=Kineobactrum salinum TaxID=2708301 RepID=A0A6C0TZV1_9GAMM|nr:cupin domain-containing protein [Kineobactrum salinum]QIB65063.1 cupin domain-containing protein [Kineobactrum salinum]